tara:strand:+ start:189 stop:803 length:615 start_codon:yes stop_codon:yes gene_type:complete
VKIGIINYNFCNPHSIYQTMKSLTDNVEIVNDANNLKKFDKIIIPGVGAANSAIKYLKENGFIDEIKEFHLKEKNIMGICLGMQLLFNNLHEHGLTKGLGFFKSDIVQIDKVYSLKTNIGWRRIKKNLTKNNTIYAIKDENYFYFCHSYYAKMKQVEEKYVQFYLKDINQIPCIIKKDNIVGFQFHPEKSQKNGIKLLINYLQS